MAFTGSVKSWRNDKGFGFLIADDGTELFAHVAALADGKLPQQGDKVSFDIEESKLKPGQFQACNVTGGSGGDASSTKGGGKGASTHVPTGTLSGTVKSYVHGKGYGFIVGPDGSDIFVHLRSIMDGRGLMQGDTVSYDLDESKAEEGKMIAVNVAGGTGWLLDGGKDGGKDKGKGKGKDSWGGDSWGGDSWGGDGGWDSWGAAKGEGKGKDGPYGVAKGKGKGKMMQMMAGIFSMMDGWGDDSWDGWGKGEGADSWGGGGKGKGADSWGKGGKGKGDGESW